MAIPFLDVHPQTIAATLAVRSVPEAVTQAVIVILVAILPFPPPLRGRVGNHVGWLEHFEYQMEHSNMKARCAGVRPGFEVFALASTSVEPCQSTFYHPPQERRLDAVTVGLATHHEHQQPATDGPGPLYQQAGIVPIGPDHPQPGRPAQQFGAIPILDVGSMHRHGQNQHQGVPIRCGACVRRPFGLRRSLGSPFCRGFDRLAIGNGGTGRGRPSFAS